MELLWIDADTAIRWHAVQAAAFPRDFVGLPADPVEEVLARFVSDDHRFERLLVVDEGVDVVAATLELPLLDNLDEAQVEITVHPDHRGRGHGTAAFDALVVRCRELGRTRLMAQVPGRLDGTPSAGQGFAARLGFVDKLADVRRVLDLTVLEDAALDRLAAAALPSAAGYRLESWVDRAPADRVAGLAAMSARMSTDPPQGTLQREPEAWDDARWRQKEEVSIARYRQRLGTMAVVGEEVVAYTDLGVSHRQPEVGYQWDTIVRADHRGHRLGMLLKIANLRLLRERSPETRWVNTWNAASNTYMVSINEALGWRAVDTWTESQLDL
jgi:GNAT superfamily N-acetyltransferase